MSAIATNKERRDFLVDEIRKRIIGPGFTQETYVCSPDASDEILTERPNREYTAGFLSPEIKENTNQQDNGSPNNHAPKQSSVTTSAMFGGGDDDGLSETEGEDGNNEYTDDVIITQNTTSDDASSDDCDQEDKERERADFAPYYMGLITCLDSNCNSVEVQASYGVYKRLHTYASEVKVPWGICTKEQIDATFEEYNKYALSTLALLGKKSIYDMFVVDDVNKTISPKDVFSYTEEGSGKHKYLTPSSFPDLLYNRVVRALCSLLKDPSREYDCGYPTIKTDDFKAVLDQLVALDPVKNLLEANELGDICSRIIYDEKNRVVRIEDVKDVDFSSMPEGVSLLSLLLKNDPVKEYLLPRLLKTHFFKREQHDDVTELDISKVYGVKEISSNVELHWKTFISRKSKDKKYLRILAKNKNTKALSEGENDSSDEKVTSPEKWLYQFQLKVKSNSLVAYTEPHTSTIDKELELNEKLYGDVKMYGKGVNCALTWEYADAEDDNHKTPSWVMTTCCPRQKVRSFSTQIKVDNESGSFDQVLDVYELSYFSEKNDATIIKELRNLANSYANWHEKQSELVAEDDVLRKLIEEQNDFLERFRDNVDYLENEDRAMRCFRIANAAMYIQMLLTKDENFKDKKRQLSSYVSGFDYGNDPSKLLSYFKDKKCPKGNPICYRPFQLAFLVMNVKSTFDNDDTYRNDNVDLIWFPTGGGKTEAYLALTALTIAERRTSGGQDGVSVIMRYTLRMLTSQQFQRASYLITALDFLRRADSSISLGNKPITLGLWIGGGVTPNSVKHLKNEKPYKTYFSNVERPASDVPGDIQVPFPIASCPWCGCELAQKISATNSIISGYEPNGTIICQNYDCIFSDNTGENNGLPIIYIDENLYRNPPTLLFATVDKMAQIYKAGAEGLFGNHGDKKYRKPDLIIQDELHLISGPLGSMVGLFETIIEELCTQRDDNGNYLRRPKIIASTATTRNTAHLVKELYNRKVRTFPVSGTKYDDNFFSYAQALKESKRLYIGMASTAHTAAELEIRTIAAEIIAREVLIRKQLSAVGVNLLSAPDVLEALNDGNMRLRADYDNYWSLVSYYTNKQSLGKTCSRIGQEILENVHNMRGFITTYPALEPLTRNFDNRTTELTARQDSALIKELLVSAETPTKLQELSSSYRIVGNMDIVLATNMISVGIDIDRWNVINMIGQPPTTAEYIQASSRVGRTYDGLVVSLYNPLKNRELSYFENYIAYHQVFYKYVEPLSVTAFTEMTIQRLLCNLFASYMILVKNRQRLEDITPNDVDDIKRLLSSRSQSIDATAFAAIEKNMNKLVDRIAEIFENDRGTDGGIPLRNYIASSGKKEFPLMGSLRDVESNTIYIYDL